MTENPTEKPETTIEMAQRALDHVTNTKAWGAVKAESITKRIADAGGQPTPELAKVLKQLAEVSK